MKKMLGMLLALCMMCSAVMAVAEEERVTSISTKHFEIGYVPSSDAFHYYEENIDVEMYNLYLYEEGYWDWEVMIITTKEAVNSDYAYQVGPYAAAFDAFSGMTGQLYPENLMIIERDCGFFNGNPCGFTVQTAGETSWGDTLREMVAVAFVHNDMYGVISCEGYESEDQAIALLENMVQCVYVSGVELSENATADSAAEDESVAAEPVAEEPALVYAADPQVVYNGVHTYTLPAGMALMNDPAVVTVAKSEKYDVSFFSQLIEKDLVQTLSDNPIQFNNFALMFLSYFDDDGTLLNAFGNILIEDVGMLNGEDVAYATLDLGELKVAVCAHFYRDNSFFISATSKTISTDEVLSNILEIARSVRFDGITEEDMIADAAQDYAIITGDSAKVRTEASITAGLIRTVYKGEIFPCEGESGDFYIIEIDGKTGYVHKGVAAIQ